MVERGHMSIPSVTITGVSVVTQESVFIAHTIATMINLEFITGGIFNAHVQKGARMNKIQLYFYKHPITLNVVNRDLVDCM